LTYIILLYYYKKYNSESNIFNKLILNLDNSIDTCDELQIYKKYYYESINALMNGSEKIIEILKKQRNKRLQLPQFIRNIQKFHKQNLKE